MPLSPPARLMLLTLLGFGLGLLPGMFSSVHADDSSESSAVAILVTATEEPEQVDASEAASLLPTTGEPVPTFAADQLADAVTVLAPVVVVGSVTSDTIGKNVFDREQISTLPTGDGNVEDLLKFMPGVQAADASNTSFAAGEILPPLLSISGGRPYQNNFLIDGMGNNSLIDPAYENPHALDRLPGHPEELFLNAHLIKAVTVFDNNIPVRYGGFTGGVVDIETIDPAAEVSGALYYKTTRDAWTKFHVSPANQAAFEGSSTYYRQPHFTKHNGGFDLSLPISPSAGLLFSYQVVYSEIPLVFLNTQKDQQRLNENYLLKFVAKPTAAEKFTLQGIYSPYKGDYFTKDTLNSDFTLKGGGGSLLAGYQKKIGEGLLDLKAGVRRSENSREAPKDYLTWTNSPSKNWGTLIGSTTSKEGGFGNLDIVQDSYEVNVDWLSGPLKSGALSHTLNFGSQWLLAQGSYDRDEPSYSYRTSVPTVPPDPATVCGGDFVACVPGEQYLRLRSVYGVSHAQAKINKYAFYFDDLLTLGRFELRPGVRISYDDLMENLDVAPRVSGSIDLTGSGRSKLIAGWSRYYGDTLLTYKLREKIPYLETQSRSSVIDNNVEWTTLSRVLFVDRFSKLKTPYTDEIVAGFDQILFGGTAGFRYVRRDGKDEFALEKDPFVSGVVRYAQLNNNGQSHYESYRLSFERQWLTQFLSLNVAYDQSTSTHGDYTDILLDTDLDRQIWYKGALYSPDEMPRNDYNRPWVASLLYTAKLPAGFVFTNTTHFRDGYRSIENSGDTVDVGGTLYDKYVEISRPSSTIFDWKIDWTPPAIPVQALTLTLEIFNLFDKKTYVGAATDEYELGRQFWLGGSYSF